MDYLHIRNRMWNTYNLIYFRCSFTYPSLMNISLRCNNINRFILAIQSQVGRLGKEASRCELRAALIASAWVAARWSDYWCNIFQGLAKRIGKQKAITAIARKLLVVIWHVLTKRELDRQAQPIAIARSLMTWSSSHHLAHVHGQHRLDFVRHRLELLGIADQVPSFQANGRVHSLTA
jgi:hypothetical protein